MFPISSIINSPSSIIYHEERTIYHISPVKLSPKISRRPLYNEPPQPQPSIFHINTLSWLWRYKFANVLLIFWFLFIAQSTLFRRSSQIQTLIYLVPTPRISTKTLFYIVLDISQRVLLHTAPKCHLLLCVYSSFITPRVSLLCKCTNWSFEADMAVSALILCHYKFIYTPIIKVPSLFHGGRCVGSPAVAIHAYLC